MSINIVVVVVDHINYSNCSSSWSHGRVCWKVFVESCCYNDQSIEMIKYAGRPNCPKISSMLFVGVWPAFCFFVVVVNLAFSIIWHFVGCNRETRECLQYQRKGFSCRTASSLTRITDTVLYVLPNSRSCLLNR